MVRALSPLMLHKEPQDRACSKHPSFQRLSCPAPESSCQPRALLSLASLGKRKTEMLLAWQAKPSSNTVPQKYKGSEQGLLPAQAERDAFTGEAAFPWPLLK